MLILILQHMRTLLRHTTTNLYFQGPDRWTDEPHLAYDFRFVDRALQYAETWNLRDVEVAYPSHDFQHVDTVPIAKIASRYAAA